MAAPDVHTFLHGVMKIGAFEVLAALAKSRSGALRVLAALAKTRFGA